MNDDLFDGAAEVNRSECGTSFGLGVVTYRQLARCALRVEEYANIQPAIIRKLRERGGCELVLYGRQNVYTLRVETNSTPNRIGLFFLPMDSRLGGPGCELFRGYDCLVDWHKMTDAMIWREGEAGSEEMTEWAEIDAALREANGWV